MSNLEPSYLRYIFDGLKKGDLHPDNAAALPEGLTGLYEAAFEENKPARERQKLLETFAIWALLKKEVSAQFVAEILDVPTKEIINFIATYSNWFTSPESGKYQLYHERLKVFFLQKFSEQEIASLYNKLVNRLEKAILDQKEDEFEVYGLEFLSEYLYVDAMFIGIGKKLIDLAYSQSHWQRQLNISKGYTWSKNGLKGVMTWASKYNEDEVIICSLKMVDLHHQEQNDAAQIIGLVAEGEFDFALKRIEQFAGNDEDGLKRKFILYMLCLMELTLLESKNKPFSKEGVEKILKHLDEQLPVDHSVLNWNDFFPSFLMFQIVCCLEEINVDFLLLFYRTSSWETNWIALKGPFSDLEIDLLLKLNKSLIDFEKSNKLSNQSAIERLNRKVFYVLFRADILITLFTQGKFSHSKKILEDVLDSLTLIPSWSIKERILTLVEVFTKFTQICKTDDLIFLLNDAYSLALTEDTSMISNKEILFARIASGYLKCGQIKVAYEITNTYLTDSIVGTDGLKFSNSIKEIARTHISLGNINEAKQLLQELPTDTFENLAFKCGVLGALSTECEVNGRIEDANAFMSDAKLLLEHIYFDFDKYQALKNISLELARQKNWIEALEIARNIPDNDWRRSSSICEIAKLNSSAINFEHSKKIINEAIVSASKIDSNYNLTQVQCEICNFYLANKDFYSALIIQNEILEDFSKSPQKVLINIYREISLNLDPLSVYSYLLNYSVISRTNSNDKTDFLRNILSKLASMGKLEKANHIRERLVDTSNREASLYEIYMGALSFLKTTGSDDKLTSLNYVIESAEKLTDHSDRDKAFRVLIPEIADSGQMELAAKFANKLDTRSKLQSFCSIAQKLYETGQTDEADRMLIQVLNLTERFYKEQIFAYDKAIAVLEISSVYISIDNFSKAKELINEILKLDSGNISGYDILLHLIAMQYASMNEIEKSIEIIKKIRGETFPGEAYLEVFDILINNLNLNGIEILTEAAIEKVREEEFFIRDRIYRILKIADKLYGFGLISKSDKIIEDCIEEIRMMQTEYLEWDIDKRPISDDIIYGSGFIIDSLIRHNKLDQLFGFASQIIVVHKNIWVIIGQSLIENKGYNETLNFINQVKDSQILNSIIEGISKAVSADYKVGKDFIVPFLKLNSNFLTSKEHVLKLHALDQLFFSEINEDEILLYNRTLNIQWAIDIKNQLPN